MRYTTITICITYHFRGCCKRSDGDGSTEQIRSSYFDLEEESPASRTHRQHSYVNSEVSNQPTCSQPPPFDELNQKVQSHSKGKGHSARFQASNGNEYASVCMKKNDKRAPPGQYDDLCHVTGACGSNRGSTSTEGDYDIVWDSVKFGKHLSSLTKSAKRSSSSSENIYTEIDKVTRVELPAKSGNDYITAQSKVWTPHSGVQTKSGKMSVGRTRSKSY